MVKINLTRISALLVAFFMLGATADAQIKVWGAGSTTGSADGEFANAFVQAGTYAPGDNITSWTALSVSDGGGVNIPGAAYWTRSTLGYSQGAYWGGTTAVGSASAANGVAIFDSDFLDNAGTPGNFGLGTSPSPHRGELISPRIDLTGNVNTAIVAEFFAFYRDFNGASNMQVGISIDDGLTWTDSDFKSSVADLTQGNARILFPTVTAGATNLTQCRVRFTFDGDYYFLIVDDISLEVAPDFDIAMGNAYAAGTSVLDAGDNVKVGGRRNIALSNLDPTDLREWLFGGRVINLGGSDILPSASPKLHMRIDYQDALTGAVTAGVYRDSLDLDTLVAGDAEGVVNIELLDNIDFIMTRPNGGDYQVTYWASHNNTDGNTSNDTVRHIFTVTTQSTTGVTNSAYISNARNDANGGVGASTGIFPGGGPYAGWEYGTVYYFPNGTTDTVTLDSVSFRYRLTNGFSGAASQTMFCNVYKMDAGAVSGGTLSDGTLLTQIGLATIPLTGLGTTGTAAGDYGRTTVTGFVDAATGTPLGMLEDNAFYYISVQTKPSLTGGVATFDSDDVPWIGGENRINYYMNASQSVPDTIINPSPLNTEDAAGAVSWNWIGFGSDQVPALGLYITGRSNKIAVSTVNDLEGADFSVYPNPATAVLNVEFSLENATDVTYIVTDMTGRVVNMIQSNNVTNDVQSIDVSEMAAGVYMITAKTEKGTSTKRFTVK
ncbi:MAG: T9SS type A sorting domain-containing protein [Aureispira sp.]